MMQMLLISMAITLNFIFIQLNHPLAMGLVLLLQTTMMTLLLGIMTKTFWFSYILFLIFVGALLVLFIYVTSIASNEMFSFSMKLMFYSMMMFITIFLTTYLFFNQFNMSFIINNEMELLNNYTSYIMENTMNLNKLYNYPNNLVTIMLIMYLLITLIAIVKITKLFYGPLRSMN